MDFFNILFMLGGLGLFLYGMQVASGSLESVAGGKLESTLTRMTSSKVRGVLTGAGITAVIQSSSATTVMVVGFVNVGIMKLSQAVSVIMGANIGTTVTAQILRLGDISGDAFILRLLKPVSLASIMLIVGALILMFAKKKRIRSVATIAVGLGTLFIGMYLMETAMSPLVDMPGFQNLMVAFSNPVLGVLAGMCITALIQSSSASISILQALSVTGGLTYSTVIPIIMGQNIGTCITAMLASIGASKNARRAAMVHLYFNVCGTVLFLGAVYAVQYTAGWPFWNDVVSRGSIADFHTLFNVACTLVFLPFSKLLEKLAVLTVRDRGETEPKADRLDERFIQTPGVALEQCRKTVLDMAAAAQQNFGLACGLITEFDPKRMALVSENEDYLDKIETRINDYLIKVGDQDLTEYEAQMSTELLHTVSDIERIGDHCENIAEAGEEAFVNDVKFSKNARAELATMADAVAEILRITFDAYTTRSAAMANRVEPLEEVVDLMKETLKTKHIKRLQKQKCTVHSGVVFLEILTNFERIADHCSNIAVYVLQSQDPGEDFDPHEHLRKMHEGTSEEYKTYFKQYEDKYYKAIL